MNKDFIFHLYNVEHENFLKLIEKCPEEVRMVVPEGFNTSLFWHLGHVLRLTEFHVFDLAEHPTTLPENYYDLFFHGTKATDWTKEQLNQLPEWDTMIDLLKQQPKHIYNTLHDKLEVSVPENFNNAENIGELILTTTQHLSNHNGVVTAMLQVLENQINLKEYKIKKLSKLQYDVTQKGMDEMPFNNKYWDNEEQGIYVDIISGEALFSSEDKFDAGTGWPSFTKPIDPNNVVLKKGGLLSMKTVAKSRAGDSYLGDLFKDGPTGNRYCINSEALKFIPKDELEKKGYGAYLKDFK